MLAVKQLDMLRDEKALRFFGRAWRIGRVLQNPSRGMHADRAEVARMGLASALVSQRYAIFARLGRAEIHATVGVAPDGLVAAKATASFADLMVLLD